MLCQAMNWNQLPMEGGLYSQHPDLLEKFQYIFQEQAKAEREKAEREKRKTSRPGRG